MKEEVLNIKNQSIGEINEAVDQKQLNNLEKKYLGRSGKFNEIISNIASIPQAERKPTGIVINEAKNLIQQQINEKKQELKSLNNGWFDPTLPAKKPPIGNTHAITKAVNEISVIFERLGFTRVRYPEVEWDWFAFGSLNFPDEHPARDDWETFFVDHKPHSEYGQMLLTPHTSSGQVREMKRKDTPIRMINISKCYRRQSDASHYPMFHQFEGLVIDKGINLTHLKGTLDHFARQFYTQGTKTRIRSYDFLFTEPSFEVDISCTICHGKGCKLCTEGWLEIGGAGMVHPNVLKNGGIDPEKYTGFAFGWGVERVYMIKPEIQIPDLRLLYSNDLSVLEQF